MGISWPLISGMGNGEKSLSSFRHIIKIELRSELSSQELALYGEEMLTAELPETAKQKIENEREKIMNQC